MTHQNQTWKLRCMHLSMTSLQIRITLCSSFSNWIFIAVQTNHTKWKSRVPATHANWWHTTVKEITLIWLNPSHSYDFFLFVKTETLNNRFYLSVIQCDVAKEMCWTLILSSFTAKRKKQNQYAWQAWFDNNRTQYSYIERSPHAIRD